MYSFAIWVTTKCNMRCSYCYEGNEKESFILDKKTADEIVSFILSKVNKSEITIIDFHGGEPLLNFSAIKYIVEKLKNEYSEYDFTYGITTNGTINTPDILDFLAKNFSYSLSVSLDGTRNAHDSNRLLASGEGSYYKAMDTALILLKNKKRHDLRVRMTVVPNNVEELAEGVIDLIEKGFKIIIPVVDCYDKSWEKSDLEIIRVQLGTIKEYLIDNNLLSSVVVAMVNESNHLLGECGGGITSFHILPNGDIYPCAYSVGNAEEKIGDIYQGINQKRIRYFTQIYSKPNEECEGCADYEKCVSTRCKFLNHSVMGEYTKPIPTICAVENIKHDMSTH